MSELDLTPIKARCEAATEGPWKWEWADGVFSALTLGQADDVCGYGHVLTSERCPACIDAGTPDEHPCTLPKQEDSDFIAHAREDIPYLLAEVTRLEAENAALRKAGA